MMVMNFAALLESMYSLAESCVDGSGNLLKVVSFGFVPETKDFIEKHCADFSNPRIGLQDENSVIPLLYYYDASKHMSVREYCQYITDDEDEPTVVDEEAALASRPMVDLYGRYWDCVNGAIEGATETCKDCIRKKKKGTATITVYGRLYSAKGHKAVLEASFLAYAEGRDGEYIIDVLTTMVGLFAKYNELRFEFSLR